MKKLVYDRSPVDSVRTVDDNGYLHVGISNITKEQVAPYLGSEIPGFEKLGLKPDEIYNVYRPAAELSKPATVESLNGIPVLLKHAEDSAEAPASNRVGSTGTDAKWESPYLTNSLHIQDADAIRRINDGTMREISMGYFYTPVLRHGEFEGEPYDVVMTDISCNHVALVEEGRAGHDVSVKDSTLTLPAGGGKEEPETSSELKQENDDMNEKEKALAEILEIVAGAGIDPEAFKQKLDAVINIKDDSQTTDEDTEESKAFAEGVEYGEEKEKAEPEKLDREHESEGEERYLEEKNEAEDGDEENDLTADAEEALKSCGLDADDPTVKAAFQQGFASGVSYGEEKEKDEPKKLDSEHESEGEKKALGQDSAAKIGAMVRAQVEAKFDAIQETSKSLGRVRASAFDTAADVYRAALKAEGVNVAGLAKRECRTAYRALMMGRQSAKRVAAMDSKPNKPDALSKMLNSIRVGE
uniref:DUF2213 domain-containing protein n=1 Tax=Siphoviridae sp. ctJ3t72 TaxID=2826240 RepID=A0A8S5QMZ6_9CAUD|nr:MAG TPA: hypothetical protein [Siphoviridae sp. ctJ3t72]